MVAGGQVVILRRLNTGLLVAELTRELFPEHEPGAEQSYFDIGFGKAEQVSGFLDGHAFDIAEDENEAVLVFEHAYGPVESFVQFTVGNDFLSVEAPLGDVLGVGDGDVAIGIRSFAQGSCVMVAAGTDDGERLVHEDAADPGTERGITPELLYMFQSGENSGLYDILGVLTVAQHVHGEVEQFYFVTSDQFLKCSKGITGIRPGNRNKIFIAGQVHGKRFSGKKLQIRNQGGEVYLAESFAGRG